jgi:hypothetical protein
MFVKNDKPNIQTNCRKVDGCMYDYLFNKQVGCQLLDEELFEHDDEIL